MLEKHPDGPHRGTGRSDSTNTDILAAMSPIQIQAAAKAYADTLSKLDECQTPTTSPHVSSHLILTGSSDSFTDGSGSIVPPTTTSESEDDESIREG